MGEGEKGGRSVHSRIVEELNQSVYEMSEVRGPFRHVLRSPFTVVKTGLK